MSERVKCIGSDGKEYLRQPCDIRQRTMGYYAPIVRVNLGKRSEFYSRKYYRTDCICPRDFDLIKTNQDFILKYS